MFKLPKCPLLLSLHLPPFPFHQHHPSLPSPPPPPTTPTSPMVSSSGSSSSTPFWTYVIHHATNLHPRQNDTNKCRFTPKKTPPLCMGNPSIQPKLNLPQIPHQHQNENLARFLQKGNANQVLELMGQGIFVDYSDFLYLEW